MVEVDGDQRFVVVTQNSGVSFASSLHDGVDFFNRRVTTGHERQVTEGNVDRRHANSETVQLTVQFRQNLTDSSGSTRLRRDHGVRSGTSTAEVLVINVRHVLVVRVSVDRRHQTVDNAESVVQGLHNRSQAVRRAGSVGNDRHVSRQNVVVHAIDDRSVNLDRKSVV